MKPSRRLLWALSVLVVLSLITIKTRLWFGAADAFWPNALWTGAAVLLLVVVVVDALWVWRLPKIDVRRVLPATLALSEQQEVTLQLRNPLQRQVAIVVHDFSPEQCVSEGLPATLTIASDTSAVVRYRVVPMSRGAGVFSATELFRGSPLGFWLKRERTDNAQEVRIFPNFLAVGRLESMRFEQQLRHIGVHISQRRGDGTEFHQLRHYREGDALRQIDWKSTARHRAPISREYQQENDHQVIFLLDCGRRMRAKDGQLAFFDHCLNALLIASLIAERQGDAVGLLTFAGPTLWFAPQRGPTTVKQLTNQIYALSTTQHSTDYRVAAQQLLERHRKRSLVFILSHLQSEDDDDLLAAHRLLKPHHHVMAVHLEQPIIDELITLDVQRNDDVLRTLSAHNYAQREKTLRTRLIGNGLPVVTAQPRTLHRELVTQYLMLKRAGTV